LGSGALVPATGVLGLAVSGFASVVAVAVGWAAFGRFATSVGLVCVVFSLAVREARPGMVTRGIRIRGKSGLPSGMRES